MKKFAAILIVIVISVSLTGCRSESNDNKSETSINSTAQTYGSDDKTAANESSEASAYSKEAVLSAYRSGEASGLDELNLKVLTTLKLWIDEIYTDGMTDEEIVISAHDYLVTHCTYDTDELSIFHSSNPDSDSPYGVFSNGMGICSGYTSTFQLLMDALGIECISVSGEALDEEHAWNMVKLDDKWYHVDCTWDDFVPDYETRMPFHTYLLVNDSAIKVSHIWEYEKTPPADDSKKAYLFQSGLYADDIDDLNRIVAQAKQKGQDHAEVAVPKAPGLDFPTSKDAKVLAIWTIDMGEYNVNVYYLTEEVLNLSI